MAHWHWDYGYTEMWGPIVGVQAQNGVTIWLNVYIMTVVTVCPKRRFLAVAIVTLGTILQYILCFELFVNAAVPYVHFIDLIAFGHSLFYLAHLCWTEK